ncbi:Pyoverdine/dityrosine biosynthesis family protein [Candida albicans]|uniref:Pyoverdine/dityrosine biosynthesis family protein n=1 Tax=Candida albicans TaxID=5476 RepID=A0A8H6BYS9_CANAX|nr:Pyoverdine/dityrosine biosynthesis family protein [Candida albicans]
MVANTFASELKHTVENDQWESVGEAFFSKSIDFFTSRWQPLEAVLPAFPCKSSNIEKVAGDMPDKGEELALSRLIQFADSLQKYILSVLLFGLLVTVMCLVIVLGDDSKVNRYFQEIFKCFGNSGFDVGWVENVTLGHHLHTEIDEQSEFCRKILVSSCDTDCGKLRQDITTTGHPRLSLFRGFSKFMTEDLALHPTTSHLTRKKFKKIVAKIAFEMIKRNDAYSNLVELMFPFHLRFSIHAHCNSGPKFVVKIDNCDIYFIIKSNKVEEEIRKGNGSGGWDPNNLHYIFFSNQ